MPLKIAPPPAPYTPTPEERALVQELLSLPLASGDPHSFAEPLAEHLVVGKRRLTLANPAWSHIGEFTCDSCEAKNTCVVSFDPQNTDGVCVLRTDLLKAQRQ